MSDGIEVVRRAMAALASTGVEGMVRHVHPDFEMATPPEVAAEPGTYRGRDGVRRWFDEFYEVMDEVTLDATELEPAGEGAVVGTITIRTRAATTGIETSLQVPVVCDVADGQIVGMRFFGSREEALAAA
jgi:ketosteroid isomerase-like protein